ncbi:hypothetical protein Agabi119p4_1846 [Agaricus bisporus var. burnettii]|uniref:Uncharacterized protein n=1 Tax=Agaricus bisporus var. burnettii TaxID=192524 RepID=A0A8H7F844_AGABI|nr:hypothetical protein Agabi119p4_1846 [Agaricus bisporus var. burnettii]
MRSLADHIDILGRNTKNITTLVDNASRNPLSTGPFANAILQCHLGDLIRDVDPSELGLFSLVQPQRNSMQEKEVERINFHGATPLRRPHSRHDDKSRRDAGPEIYAKAAMKYMDRYKLVRPMPRAQDQIQQILARVPILRQSIEDLTDNLRQLEQVQTSTHLDYRSQIDEEEQRIQDLRATLTELTSKRLTLIKGRKTHLDLAENTQKPLASSKPRTEEDEFWSTPAAPTRALKFSGENMLMDERADFGDMSVISFTSGPTPKVLTDSLRDNIERPLFQHATPNLIQNEVTTSQPNVLLMKPLESAVDPAQDPPENDTPDAESESHSSPQHQTLDVDEVKASDHETVLGITITNEVEVIVNKIWTVMKDLVVSAAAIKKVELPGKPSTREIIDLLESLRDISLTDESSPTSGNNAPAFQQILTATLLIGLITTSADHSLSLSKVKELLASRTAGTTNASQPYGSRIVYGSLSLTYDAHAVRVDLGTQMMPRYMNL